MRRAWKEDIEHTLTDLRDLDAQAEQLLARYRCLEPTSDLVEPDKAGTQPGDTSASRGSQIHPRGVNSDPLISRDRLMPLVSGDGDDDESG
jgi:hypothetical protein